MVFSRTTKKTWLCYAIRMDGWMGGMDILSVLEAWFDFVREDGEVDAAIGVRVVQASYNIMVNLGLVTICDDE